MIPTQISIFGISVPFNVHLNQGLRYLYEETHRLNQHFYLESDYCYYSILATQHHQLVESQRYVNKEENVKLSFSPPFTDVAARLCALTLLQWLQMLRGVQLHHLSRLSAPSTGFP